MALTSSSALRRHRWLILAIAWTALLLAGTDRALWPTSAPVASRDIGLDPAAALGAFVAATQSGYLIALVAGSFAADRFGPRKLLAMAMLWLGAAMLAFGRIDTLAAGLAAQFCIGAGAAPVFAIGLKLIVGWFPPDRRATAISLFMTALPMPTILVNLIAPISIAWFGWRGNYAAVGLLTMTFGMAFALFGRDGPGTETGSRLSLLAPLGLLRQRGFRLVVIANMAAPCATWGFMIWANLVLIDRYGIMLADASGIVATYGMGGFVGLLLAGPICERCGFDRRHALIACFLLFAVALLAIGCLNDLAAIRIAVPLLGMIAYSYGPLLNLMIANAAGRLAASAAGLATILTFAAESIQPIAISYLYGRTHSFALLCAALAVGPVIAALAICLIRDDEERDIAGLVVNAQSPVP